MTVFTAIVTYKKEAIEENKNKNKKINNQSNE